MLGEILDSVTDLVDLADRNLTRIFADPWPPVDPRRPTTHHTVYTKRHTYYSNAQTSSHRVAQRGPAPRPRAPVNSYPGRATAAATRYPQGMNSKPINRPTSGPRKPPINASQRKVSPIARAPSAPIIPSRPISAPSAIGGTSGAYVREKRVTAKPNPDGRVRMQRLRLDDFRPDLAQCDVLVIAIAEMELCKEIFAGWRAQLHLGDPRRTDKLELSIVSTVRKLDSDASAALRASHSLLRNYRLMLSTIERNLNDISRSKTGGSPFSSEISSLAISISAHSRALSNHIKTMQERLRSLVRDIEKTKESADKRALKRKIWKWIARVFKALAMLISAGGAIVSLVHPVGLLESVAVGGASMLTGAVARLCELVQDRYNETTFDEILAFLRNHIPESAKAAEIALTSFQACHRILQIELEVRKGERSGWVSPKEARRAQGQWTKAEERLRMPRSYGNERLGVGR